LSGDGEVLAGEAAAEKINGPTFTPMLLATRSVGDCSSVTDRLNGSPHVAYVLVDGHSGPPCGEHLSPVDAGLPLCAFSLGSVRVTASLTEREMSKPSL
jgi:hypothetical protein